MRLPEKMPQHGRFGAWRAAGYSIAGLRGTAQEAAFRQEVILLSLRLLVFWLGRNGIERALLLGSLLLVHELLNCGGGDRGPHQQEASPAFRSRQGHGIGGVFLHPARDHLVAGPRDGARRPDGNVVATVERRTVTARIGNADSRSQI